MLNTTKICKYYIERKKRFCKFQVIEDAEFCNVHNKDNDQKILCPYQKQTYINKKNLQRHLQVCPKFKDKKKKQQSQWYQKGINSLQKQSLELENLNQINIKSLYQQKNPILVKVLHKLPSLFFNIFEKQYPTNFLEFLDITQKKNLQTENKDHIQGKLLTKLIQDYKLLSTQNIYVQFGAGKGLLSSTIANMIKNNKSKHVLLERQARRNKFDRNFRDYPYFQRYRSDVQDFNLSKIRQIMIENITKNQKFRDQNIQSYKNQLQQSSIVGVCKHMCGMATDLSIQALNNASKSINIAGGVMATCCHHLCELKNFSNLQFFKKYEIENEQIDMIFKLSSWGVMKQHKNEAFGIRTKLQIIENIECNIKELKEWNKILIGKMCKRIIDIARSEALCLKLKRNVKLVRYCSQDITPQNVAIVIY